LRTNIAAINKTLGKQNCLTYVKERQQIDLLSSSNGLKMSEKKSTKVAYI